VRWGGPSVARPLRRRTTPVELPRNVAMELGTRLDMLRFLMRDRDTRFVRRVRRGIPRLRNRDHQDATAGAPSERDLSAAGRYAPPGASRPCPHPQRPAPAAPARPVRDARQRPSTALGTPTPVARTRASPCRHPSRFRPPLRVVTRRRADRMCGRPRWSDPRIPACRLNAGAGRGVCLLVVHAPAGSCPPSRPGSHRAAKTCPPAPTSRRTSASLAECDILAHARSASKARQPSPGALQAAGVLVKFEPGPPGDLDALPNENGWKWIFPAYAQPIASWAPIWTLSNVARAGHEPLDPFAVIVSYAGPDGTRYTERYEIDPGPILKATSSGPSDTKDPFDWEKCNVPGAGGSGAAESLRIRPRLNNRNLPRTARCPGMVSLAVRVDRAGLLRGPCATADTRPGPGPTPAAPALGGRRGGRRTLPLAAHVVGARSASNDRPYPCRPLVTSAL
jgi:hypothetical protein